MSEYLKMADVFIGDVIAGDDDLIRDEDGLIGDMQWPPDCVKYAAHAINSHDALVSQHDELLKALEEIASCATPYGNRAHSMEKIARAAIAKAKGGAV